MCLLMAVIFLSGCENGLFGEKSFKSAEKLYENFCKINTAEKLNAEKYLALFSKEYQSELKDGKSIEELQKMLDERGNPNASKKCRYEVTKTFLEDELRSTEESYNRENNTDYKFKACKTVDLYIDDKKTDNSTACEIDGKWSIFEY